MGKILWTEIKRFIKNNYKKVIVLSLIIGLIYTVVINKVLGQNETAQNDDVVEVSEELAEYYTGFQIYIEYEDGRSFANTTLLEEYILQPGIIEKAEASTDTKILSKIQELEELGFEKNGDNRGVLGVIRGDYSDIFTILINVGTAKENMEVAEYYLEELTSGGISFLENKKIYVWNGPQVFSDSEEDVPESEVLGNNFNNTTIIDYIFDMIIGTIFGFIISFLLLVFWSLLKERNLYSFTYNRGSDDVFLLYDTTNKDAGSLAQLILYPLNYNKVIIHHTDLPKNLQIELDKKSQDMQTSVEFVSEMADAPVKSDNTEVIIMINSSLDSKRWYRKQRQLADTYHLPVKVVQINS